MFDTLKRNNSRIAEIMFWTNNLDDQCMKSLGEYIQNSKNLKYISLYQNEFTDKGIEILTPFLVGNTTLGSIDFRSNEGVTDASGPYILEIARTSHMNSFGLVCTNVSGKMICEILKVFQVPAQKRRVQIASSSESQQIPGFAMASSA